MERTSNKSQRRKLTLEDKILPPLLPGFELATFRSRVRRSTNKLFRLYLESEHYYLHTRTQNRLDYLLSKGAGESGVIVDPSVTGSRAVVGK